MFIPTTGIIMSSIYGLNIKILILFAVLLVYVYSYCALALYVSTGYKLLDLDSVVQTPVKVITTPAKTVKQTSVSTIPKMESYQEFTLYEVVKRWIDIIQA